MIRIKSKRAGFRRCGIAHPSTPVEYPDDRFSKAELAILKAEPMLTVEVVKSASQSEPNETDNAETAAKAGKKGKK